MKTELGRTVADMLQNCMPKEMIVLAIDMYVLALESTRHQVDETAERRRAWDREYRKRQRKRPPDKPDIHPTSADETSLILREGKKLSEVVVKKERKKEGRGCKLPPDWIPKLKHYEEGEKRGMDRTRVDYLAEDMRIWCASNSNRAVTTKSSWDQAFMGWIRRGPQGNGNAVSNNRADTVAGRATAREAQQIAAMGRAASNRLASRNSTGPDNGEASGSSGSAEVFDIRKRAENSY